MVAGWGKLTHLGDATKFFDGLGIPFPGVNAVVASSTECLGGLLLLLGVAGRLVPLPLIFVMIIAYATAEKEAAAAIFSNPDKFVSATPFLFLLASVIVLVFGPGVFSLDWIIGRKCAKAAVTDAAAPAKMP